MKDIETREDLELLLSEFYEVATKDKEIGHHFDNLDLKNHLPVIINFWEKMLFGKPVYFGNPVAVHKFLHELTPLKTEHFQRWYKIFSTKVDELFAGKTAEDAKLRAKMIAHNFNKMLEKDNR